MRPRSGGTRIGGRVNGDGSLGPAARIEGKTSIHNMQRTTRTLVYRPTAAPFTWPFQHVQILDRRESI